MIRSRALLIGLTVPTLIVAGFGPFALGLISETRTTADELAGPGITAAAAVDAEVAAGLSLADSLEQSLGGVDPDLIAELLDRFGAEEDTWSSAERALEAAGAPHLDDSVHAARERMRAVFDLFSEQYVRNEIPDDIGAQVAEAQNAYSGYRAELETFDDRVRAALVDPALATVADNTGTMYALTVFGIASLLVFLLGSIVVVLRSTRRTNVEAARIEAERNRTIHRTEFESRLMRGLEMAKSENAVFGLAAQAVSEAAPTRGAELLVADSSGAHFEQVATVGDVSVGCDVLSPLDCPATVRGQTSVWPDDGAIDACPYMRDRGCSATCVPVSVGGRTTGVVHMTGPVGAPPQGEELALVEIVVRRASERIAMVRAFEQTSAHAYTDALTGLPNRRAFEHRLREQRQRGEAYALAFGDLDRFKQLNDRHGHEVGDRALRLFARVLRDTLRPSDLPSRYGGEEFVLLLPDCGADEAEAVLERVRVRLAEVLEGGTVPPFTCSFGLAASTDGADPESVIRVADEALLRAKAAGRDRIVRSGDHVPVRPSTGPAGAEPAEAGNGATPAEPVEPIVSAAAAGPPAG